LIIDNKIIQFGGKPARVAINPITLTSDKDTLYYGAMNGKNWYSLSAKLIRENATDYDIENSIKKVSDKPISDGVATDNQGNHYFTNKPTTLSNEEAAVIPLTGLTAWEILFDRIRINEKDRGKTILIIGGAGGVGSIAIQLAKKVAFFIF